MNAASAFSTICRALLWIAITTTLVFALVPHPPQILACDKAEHGAAFVVLATLLTCAYPDTRWFRAALTLSMLGAVVEWLQAIPALHRDSSFADWIADDLAILTGLLLCALVTAIVHRKSGPKVTGV